MRPRCSFQAHVPLAPRPPARAALCRRPCGRLLRARGRRAAGWRLGLLDKPEEEVSDAELGRRMRELEAEREAGLGSDEVSEETFAKIREHLRETVPELEELEALIEGKLAELETATAGKQGVAADEAVGRWMRRQLDGPLWWWKRALGLRHFARLWDAGGKIVGAAFAGWLLGKLLVWNAFFPWAIALDRILGPWIMGIVPALVMLLSLLTRIKYSDVVRRLIAGYFATMSFVPGTLALLVAGKYRLALAMSGLVRVIGVRMALWRWRDYNVEVMMHSGLVNWAFATWRVIVTVFAIFSGALRLLAIIPPPILFPGYTAFDETPKIWQKIGEQCLDFLTIKYIGFYRWVISATSFHPNGLIGAFGDHVNILGKSLSASYPVALGALADHRFMFFIGSCVFLVYMMYVLFFIVFITDSLTIRVGRETSSPLKKWLLRLRILPKEFTRADKRRLRSTARGPNVKVYEPSDFMFTKRIEPLFSTEMLTIDPRYPPVMGLVNTYKQKGLGKGLDENLEKELYEDTELERLYNALSNWAAPVRGETDWNEITSMFQSNGVPLEGVRKEVDQKIDADVSPDDTFGCTVGEDEVAKITEWNVATSAETLDTSGTARAKMFNQVRELASPEWEVDYDEERAADETPIAEDDENFTLNWSAEDGDLKPWAEDNDTDNGTVYSA